MPLKHSAQQSSLRFVQIALPNALKALSASHIAQYPPLCEQQQQLTDRIQLYAILFNKHFHLGWMDD